MKEYRTFWTLLTIFHFGFIFANFPKFSKLFLSKKTF